MSQRFSLAHVFGQHCRSAMRLRYGQNAISRVQRDALSPGIIHPPPAAPWRTATAKRHGSSTCVARHTSLQQGALSRDGDFSEPSTGTARRGVTEQQSLQWQHNLAEDVSRSALSAESIQGSVQTDPKQAQASRELLLQHLRKARLRSQRLRESLRAGAQDASRQPPARKSNGVDRTVYDQLRNSRNRLSKELSEKNRMIASLERQIQERDGHLMAAHAAFSRLSQNSQDLQSLTSSAAATARYGVHSRVDHAAIALIYSRAQQLHEAFTAELEQLQSHVPREVPISWYGVASEVRLMGSFDNWTRGFDLSTEEITDSVFTTFRATVPLVPGTYLVKFLVDGEWRLAPEWPSETSSAGDTNNVLSVL